LTKETSRLTRRPEARPPSREAALRGSPEGTAATEPTALSFVTPGRATPGDLLILALAGAIGSPATGSSALVRTRAGGRLDSPALIADGNRARVEAYLSLAVIASAAAIAVGAPILDPLIGLGMTVVILRITRESWRTVREHPHHH
jgi:divalent metal cation (Fe/Co/Zn/Cd) transporter